MYEMAKKGEIDPWNVDIIDLTDKFLKKIEDLRVSGRIILYASLLLKMKSEILLSEIYGEEEEQSFEAYEEDVYYYEEFEEIKELRSITLPVRRKVKRYTTLDDLVKELRLLEKLEGRRKRKRLKVGQFQSFENIPHEEDVEEKVEEVYRILKGFNVREISFLNLIKGLDKRTKVTYYTSILHLAYRKMLRIEQDVPYGDIRVILYEGGG